MFFYRIYFLKRSDYRLGLRMANFNIEGPIFQAQELDAFLGMLSFYLERD